MKLDLDPNQAVEVLLVAPHQLAWLRRPELDRDGYRVWELPDGQLYHYGGEPPLLIQLIKQFH